MNLLEKFTSVSIETDRRITEEDRSFCETHQAAYTAALLALSELSFFWADAKKTQEGLNDLPGKYHRNDYLYSSDGVNLSLGKIYAQRIAAHSQLITSIVHYFNTTYHVTVSTHAIVEKLLPQNSDRERYYDEEYHIEYNEAMQSLRLQYQDIVDLIILQLDGRNFSEQAFYELRNKCRDAAGRPYGGTRYERRKNTLLWTDYGCSYDDYYCSSGWRLNDHIKTVLRGIAHFETGSYSSFPDRLYDLLSYGHISYDILQFPSCEKLEQVKLFKNGRVDIRFTTEAYAKEFEDIYLSAASVGGAG